MAHASCSRVFASQLSGEGMIAREGSIVDASFVDAPRQRNTREQTRRSKQASALKALRPTQLRAGRKIAMHVGRRKMPKRITVTRTTPRWMREQVGREL